MRVFTVPAMYAPAIVEALKHLVEVKVDGHQSYERLREIDAANDDVNAIAEILFPESQLDRSRSGEVMIVVASVPAESNIIALPLQRHLKVAS